MKVAIIGSGYVGLVSGVCLAEAGHEVECVDRDAPRVAAINQAVAPFYEPGLAELLARAIGAGNFRASCDVTAAVEKAEIVMLAVGTPSGEGRIDLATLGEALSEVGRALALFDDWKTVVIKSTVVPGTTDTFAAGILEKSSKKKIGSDFGLAMNPEFLREGSAIEDFANPDRIVIGAGDEGSTAALVELYAGYECPKIRTTARNAELIKYTSNALLATLISFSNEIASICESVENTDVETVMDALHLDKRLSPCIDGRRITPDILTYLRAGAGYGGSCLPKDTVALHHFGSEAGVAMQLLRAAIDVNDARPSKVAAMVGEELGELAGRRIVILGLAFKPGTNDVRESAALRVADLLLSDKAEVLAVDPIAAKYSSADIDPRLTVTDDYENAIKNADAVVLLTAWPEFSAWDWDSLVKSMRVRFILDCRNGLRGVSWPDGTRYRAIGTPFSPSERAESLG